jgi:long-subunit acyl-CoA synthetase (AMP-forming)
VILVPQLLKAMVAGIAAGMAAPATLRFAAVGGAPVSPALLERSRSLGIPAFQGYGLSEAASVVSLNLPGHDRTGSVGRPLPHARVSLTEQGEVVVHSSGFLGYLGAAPRRQNTWPTGDLGYLDADGFLHLTGRRKTAYATAFGRNVAPEWVESELTAHPLIAQAAVFGEALPFNVAVLVPRGPVSAAEVATALRGVNACLPDYAQVRRWVIAGEPFTSGNGLTNGAGGVRREAVGAHFRARIEQLYEGADIDVVL